MRPQFLILTLVLLGLLSGGCAGLLPVETVGGIPTSNNNLTFDGAISVSIKNSQNLVGTTLGYQGKSADGRAMLVINGLQAAKQTADSVTYKGSQFPGVIIDPKGQPWVVGLLRPVEDGQAPSNQPAQFFPDFLLSFCQRPLPRFDEIEKAGLLRSHWPACLLACPSTGQNQRETTKLVPPDRRCLEVVLSGYGPQ